MEAVQNVSEEVKQAARNYADNSNDVTTYGDWTMIYNAYIAGAASMKPIEHEAKPEDNNGKQ